MHRRTARGNRVGLIITAVLLLVVGAAMITINQRVFGSRPAGTHLYPAPVGRWIGQHHWIFWGVAVLATLIVLVALRWLLVQTRTDRVRSLVVDSESDARSDSGRTLLMASAVCAAVAEEAENLTGVRKATAVLAGHQDAPELWLDVTVDQDADTGTIRTLLVSTVLADARQALERPDMPSYLTLQVSTRRTDRQIA